jgi:hypothetical protein
MTRTRFFAGAALAAAVTCATASAAHACPACYGQADSPMTAGMNVAILTMVGIIGFVLSGVVAFGVMMRKRLGRIDAVRMTAPESTEHN